MELKIFKLGGSKAIILPKTILALLDVEDSQHLEANIENKKLIITKPND